MSEKHKWISLDIDSVVFFVCVALLIILFAGEPDIQDGIVKYLMQECPNE